MGEFEAIAIQAYVIGVLFGFLLGAAVTSLIRTILEKE